MVKIFNPVSLTNIFIPDDTDIEKNVKTLRKNFDRWIYQPTPGGYKVLRLSMIFILRKVGT